MHVCALVLALLAASDAPAVLVPTLADNPNEVYTDVSVLPVLGYTADDGAGGGVLGGVFWRRPGVLPYKYSLEGLLYITDRQVYADSLYFDWLRINDLPLRLIVGGIFWATLDDNFCGFGNNVTCSLTQANQAADALHLSGGARSSFVDTYYNRRYLNPTGEVKLRWQVGGTHPKVETNLAWRGSGYIPGSIGNLKPYPNNFYAQSYPAGERGFASVLQIGIMFDGRDQEGSPTSGYWIDSSARFADQAIGSTWNYSGVNATARTYLPLDRRRTWVWANRFIADFIFGDPSVAEMSQVGCYSLVPGGLQGFGGPDLGRGIRENRYIGRIRLMDQTELRWQFVGFDLWDQHFDFTAVGYVDAAWVGVDYHDFGGDPRKIITSEGMGLRLVWDRDFIVRLDVGLSAVEHYSPDVYLNVNQVF